MLDLPSFVETQDTELANSKTLEQTKPLLCDYDVGRSDALARI
jgi:hypothetical protein